MEKQQTSTPIRENQFTLKMGLIGIGVCAVGLALVPKDMWPAILESNATRTFIALVVVGFVLALVGRNLVQGIKQAADDDPNSLKVVASCADQFEATAVVTRLSDELIFAKPVGGFTSGFQVEAPGDVKVVVRQYDYDKAKRIVDAIEAESAEPV